ncbi:dienelactone hydrolase [Bradyrhizobium yuanmingense]|uniref:dienelactone hydrolase family protein n=1 Tax=Bradyrhizobium yuanmingense TaxID=108015 RepID=UPI003510E637
MTTLAELCSYRTSVNGNTRLGQRLLHFGTSLAASTKTSTALLLGLLLLVSEPVRAQAEMVSIKWRSSAPVAWVPGNDYIDGYTPNFKNATVEEGGKTQKEGALAAELLMPKGMTGRRIPFVVLLHGCSGMTPSLKKWANEYGGRLVQAGYGVLVLDSFATRGVTGNGICADPSQLEWARRRTDDAYSALDWLIETGKADPKQVYVLGRSNGATTSLIIMNRKIGDVQKNMFAGAFVMQPSCLYMKNVEFYAPVYLFLAEKDQATSPVLCSDMAKTKRPVAVQTKLWEGATHGYQDRAPDRIEEIAGKQVNFAYNAAANEGTINAIVGILNSRKR